MDLENWLKNGSIKRFEPIGTQTEDLLTSAGEDIQAAQEIIELDRYGICRDTAYEAMLKAGMALMFHFGFRPEAGSHHLIIVRFTERALGKEHQRLILAFDRLRRSRHKRLYEGKERASKSQAENAIKDAGELLAAVKKKIS